MSNLHKDIGEEDLRALFSPFGTVNSAYITVSPTRSANPRVMHFHYVLHASAYMANLLVFFFFKGTHREHAQRESGPSNSGVVTFKSVVEAQKAVAHLNGFDLAGQVRAFSIKYPL